MMETTYGVLTESTSLIGSYVIAATIFLLFVALICAVCKTSENVFVVACSVTWILLLAGGVYICNVSIPQSVNEISTSFIAEYKIETRLLENSKEDFAKSLATIEYYNEQATMLNTELQQFKDYSKHGFFKDGINEDIHLLEPVELITDKDVYGG